MKPSESARAHAAPPADAWEAAYLRFETPKQEVEKFLRRLRALGAEQWPRDAAVLELFCGRGNGLAALEHLGFQRVLGIDLSSTLLARYAGAARRCIADCRRLPVRDGSHDIVIVQGGLHHLDHLPDDLRLVLDEVSRVLKPQGLVVVVEPWLTPFLRLVHAVGCAPVVRRAWGKMDALATMIELEGEVYRRWLREPRLVSGLLKDRFEPRIAQGRWGKLFFVGRKRAAL